MELYGSRPPLSKLSTTEAAQVKGLAAQGGTNLVAHSRTRTLDTGCNGFLEKELLCLLALAPAQTNLAWPPVNLAGSSF